MRGHYEFRDPYVFAQQWWGNHQINHAKWDKEKSVPYVITKYGVRKDLVMNCWVVQMQDKSIDVFTHEEFKKLFQSAFING